MDHEVEDDPEGSEFSIRVRATIPSTGQLLRWLLGARGQPGGGLPT
jgi:proteasome accessory factor B